ncbi:hypothetical protein HPB51_027420 [Rhipicephalus microplus]|uniref:Uncharacterized protein n=1 Tax=Rhipicephalus microplus TaxID=6941 RepID=A0A9J6D0B1_RHIMP|nr:hypothetical protein HPB51_027420 [Rhipicephalus microplus]
MLPVRRLAARYKARRLPGSDRVDGSDHCGPPVAERFNVQDEVQLSIWARIPCIISKAAAVRRCEFNWESPSRQILPTTPAVGAPAAIESPDRAAPSRQRARAREAGGDGKAPHKILKKRKKERAISLSPLSRTPPSETPAPLSNSAIRNALGLAVRPSAAPFRRYTRSSPGFCCCYGRRYRGIGPSPPEARCLSPILRRGNGRNAGARPASEISRALASVAPAPYPVDVV